MWERQGIESTLTMLCEPLLLYLVARYCGFEIAFLRYSSEADCCFKTLCSIRIVFSYIIAGYLQPGLHLKGGCWCVFFFFLGIDMD